MARWFTAVLVLLAALLGALALTQPVDAARVPDVRNTKHNLSTSGPGDTRATDASQQTQVCVFCHTPHGAENIPKAPLWNRKLTPDTYPYTSYSSKSIEATVTGELPPPGGSSKLCLSCHDGTMALGSVNVLNGAKDVLIPMTGTGSMPVGSGATTGFTRNIGLNLTNDHPISFTYDGTLAGADGELRTPGASGVAVATRSAGVKPTLPLETGGVMQCATCHDPHVRETDAAKGPGKFLRANRFQVGDPTGGAFDADRDIICIACHDKDGQTWALSAHSNPKVATQTFTLSAAQAREFPTTLPVYKAACLSCHDTHTVQGARRLLREGTNSTSSPKVGGSSAIEETCYQCHSSSGSLVLSNVATVPDIKTEFGLLRRMPITGADQQGGGEVHDIGTGSGSQRGKDFVESTTLLGGVSTNRHVECTDCHNPHRVIKNHRFDANATNPDARGSHSHTARHNNIASGVLKGTTGVEPTGYVSPQFGTNASGFTLKKGVGTSDLVGSAWVTREYQVCLKCHSSYAYGTTPPDLEKSGGGTPKTYTTNGLTKYTDQAMEFQAPHPGVTSRDTIADNSGAYRGLRPGCSTALASECGTGTCVCKATEVNYQTRNWRSWHPVMAPTKRSLALRGITDTSPWLSPWGASADVGEQTMYCSDCHGSETAANTVVPTGSKPWGPHGSDKDFILKGAWTRNSGNPDKATNLCLKCHDSAVYAGSSSAKRTGFWDPDSSVSDGNGRGNLHNYHNGKITGGIRCTWCHTAVPHGWKNRSFLVNLNDVGPEAGKAAGTQVRNHTSNGYDAPPYYWRAVLKIRTFGVPGQWVHTNCGSAGAPGNGSSGRNWMRDSDENCKVVP